MSEENEVTLEQLQATVEDLTSQLGKVKNKNEELLTEKKRAQAAKAEAEEHARMEAEEKLKASSNYKELHKSSEAERQKLLDELNGLKTGIANEKRNAAATKLAAELAEGSNVELMAEFVAKRLKYVENEVKVVNENGELTVSTLDDLKQSFQSDARYAALLKGNKSSGGSAAGGSNGNGVSKQKTRSEFEALNAGDRMKFIKSGGTITA